MGYPSQIETEEGRRRWENIYAAVLAAQVGECMRRGDSDAITDLSSLGRMMQEAATVADLEYEVRTTITLD